jgi:hypothetical protein
MFVYVLKGIEAEVSRILKESAARSPGYETALLNLSKAIKEVLKFW